MELQVPGEKIKKTRAKCEESQAMTLSCLIGKMTSVAQAIPPAPLFYRSLQRDISIDLAQGNQQYNVPCPFLREARRSWSGKQTTYMYNVQTDIQLHVHRM